MQVDYRQTKLEVYREVAVRCLRLGSAAILDHVIDNPHGSESWPSWVPDWTLDDGSLAWSLSPSAHNAGKDSKPEYLSTEDVNTISLTGVSVGTIQSISAVLPNTKDGDCTFKFDAANVGQSILRLKRLLTCNQGKISNETWARYMLQHLDAAKLDSYVTFGDVCCDTCDRVISKQGASLSCPEFYHCRICSNGDFDICIDCHEMKGLMCQELQSCATSERSQEDLDSLPTRGPRRTEEIRRRTPRGNHTGVILGDYWPGILVV